MNVALGSQITKRSEADALPVGTSCIYKESFYGLMVATTKHEKGWYTASDWESLVDVSQFLPMIIVHIPGA